MLHGEAVTTGTCCGSMKRQPTISECECIPKSPFLLGKTELVDLKSGKPTGVWRHLSLEQVSWPTGGGGERVGKSWLELMAYESVVGCFGSKSYSSLM